MAYIGFVFSSNSSINCAKCGERLPCPMDQGGDPFAVLLKHTPICHKT